MKGDSKRRPPETLCVSSGLVFGGDKGIIIEADKLEFGRKNMRRIYKKMFKIFAFIILLFVVILLAVYINHRIVWIKNKNC